MKVIVRIFTQKPKNVHICGNITTSYHIKAMLQDYYTVEVHSYNDDVLFNKSDILIMIHLHHAALFFSRNSELKCSKVICLASGTDVNVNLSESKSHKLIKDFLLSKKCHVIFLQKCNQDRFLAAITSYPDEHMSIIHPAVQPLVESFQVSTPVIPIDFYVIVANIRPVKDILFCANSMRDICQNSNWPVAFVLIGGIIDSDYARDVLQVFQCCSIQDVSSSGLYYVGQLNHANVLKCISQSRGLINSSLSEGCCLSILEAMASRAPVFARNIDSNAELLHEGCGYLYNTPEDFKELIVKYHDENNELMLNMASRKVKELHSPTNEKQLYLDLLHS